ncbi:MAG: MFS transporter [Patescibacteria group bacterium]
MQRQVKELFISSVLVNFALALVMLWEPVYLYQINYPLQKIILFYLLTYLGYMLTMPLGAKFAKRYGYEPSIAIGVCLFAFYYLGLYLIKDYPFLFYVVPFIFTWQKTFYWPAYHANFARFSEAKEEGREVGVMTVITSVVYIIGPALAGFIIAQFGYAALFIFAAVVFFASNIPMMITKESFTPEGFSFTIVYKQLVSKINRKSLLAYLGFGEEFIVLAIWPIFISLIITNVFDMGVVVALATLVTTVITLYVGKLSDRGQDHRILSLSSAFYSLSWFIRIFVNSATGVFFLDTLSRLGKNTISVPLTAITYERAKSVKPDQHRHIMSNVLFFEMSLVVGKLLAIILIYLALFFVADNILAFKITFILAGAMSLLYMLL